MLLFVIMNVKYSCNDNIIYPRKNMRLKVHGIQLSQNDTVFATLKGIKERFTTIYKIISSFNYVRG